MRKIKLSLNQESPCEAYSKIRDVRIEIKKGTSDILIFDEMPDSDELALTRAFESSNRFLDNLSWKHKIHLQVKTDSYIIESNKGISIGVPCISITCELLPASVAITDSTGNVTVFDSASIGKIDVNESGAGTYYRQANLDDHPFIKFENYYRTIENIADRIKRNKKNDDNWLHKKHKSLSYEKSLLRFSLEECFCKDIEQLFKISKSIPSISISGKSRIFEELTEQIYEGYRNKITHSKKVKNPFNPNKESDKKKVQEILPLIEFIARSLLKYEQNTFH